MWLLMIVVANMVARVITREGIQVNTSCGQLGEC